MCRILNMKGVRKMKRVLIALTVLVSGFVLVGCGNSEEAKLVGTWHYESERGELFSELVFNADNTGYDNSELLGTETSLPFEWTVDDGVILIEYELSDSEGWLFRIDDGSLIYDDSLFIVTPDVHFEFEYKRVD